MLSPSSPSDPSQRCAPIRLLLRSKEAVELYKLPDTSPTSSPAKGKTTKKRGGTILHDGPTTFHLLSPDGRRAYIHDASVGLIECHLGCDDNDDDESVERRRDHDARGRPFLEGDSRPVQLAKCSPRGSYLLTWERPGSVSTGGGGDDGEDGGGGNLKAWDASTGRLLRGFHCKRATLNTLQWTHDERLAFHLVTNEVHVYAGNDLRRGVGKIRCQSLSSFSLPNVRGTPANIIPSKDGEGRYLLTVFVPGIKGRPARVDLLRYPDRLGRESSTVAMTGGTNDRAASGPSLASKSLYDAEEASVHWSPRADAALVQTQTSIDATGESYYGSSHLFLFAEDDVKKTGNGTAISVTLPKESTRTSGGAVPIVSASWMPNPQITGPVPFGVISGTMPALASLHHGITGEPTFLLGMAHRNTMDASPHGRFVVTGGYGNLAGGIDFWDRNKGKRIPRRVILPPPENRAGETASYVTMREERDLVVTSPRPVWAPDSRTYMVSTTSPRMNVDNGVSIYRYDGSLVDDSILPWDNARYGPDKLLCAEFVPAPFPSSDVGEKECRGGAGSREFYYYPDRPQSPPPRGMVEVKGDAAEIALAKLMASRNNGRSSANVMGGGDSNGKGGIASKAAAYIPPAARKGGAYVPPGARKGVTGSATSGVGGGGSLAERMRQEREGSAVNVSGVKVVKRTGPVGASSVIPAYAVATASASEKSKSAMRREKQLLAREKAEREAEEAERRRAEDERARIEANKADPEKRAKKISKMLKQIDEIKSKQANGAELNDDQRKKIEAEEELRRELESLGLITRYLRSAWKESTGRMPFQNWDEVVVLLRWRRSTRKDSTQRMQRTSWACWCLGGDRCGRYKTGGREGGVQMNT
ncbi:hypothetical protein ACHAXA_006248 [Cyclostephanos tholiformis]|uniref:Translation initiation factor beta propellor-like domain-containing protein n=1 Tax=Cyclostephanos tholiformis TaxID=382380 RepID=A0ABD3SNP8_9STRA